MSREQPKPTGGNAVLIDRILADARDEAQKIRTEAASSVAKRQEALNKRLTEIDAETDRRIAEEQEKQRMRTDSAISLAQNRSKLRIENRVYELARERCVSSLEDMRESPGYAAVIRDWVVEAARGLGSEEAVVRCAAEDRSAVESVLDEAQAILASEHGRNVELQFDETPAAGQGVVLRDPQAHRSFSNTVADRMRRYSNKLRRIVYHKVIEGIHG